MKTIEERAYEFACKNNKPSSFFCDLEKSYTDGATEQKDIDAAELAEIKRQRDEYYNELLMLREKKVEIIAEEISEKRAIAIDKALAMADKLIWSWQVLSIILSPSTGKNEMLERIRKSMEEEK